MDRKALQKISYGLYLLTARDGEKDNGCIVNTVIQATHAPNRISVAVNKNSLTHELIAGTGLFTASVLSADAPYELFQSFGMRSGRDADKFAGFSDAVRDENGLYRLTKYASAFLSGKVVQAVDVGGHTLFVADLTGAETLSQEPSLTYADYFARVKPQAGPAKQEGKTAWRCKICGYVYEGETLPEDYVCPLCKHGAEDFEKIVL